MDIRTTTEADSACVALSGRFDFSSHRDFREITESLLAQGDIRHIELDLSAVEYMDSSALGMLLMLRDKARAADCDITLAHCVQSVREVIEVANFHKLFSVI
ncbi:STAS domain-containing protein [Methyloversatilis thermotolerans]|uniref:STAS domain-containing protein n=1 Tax=Methyloversatilis thermotolerans TaxID=1346290 RepID=UPI00036C9BFA|nr:STAS domain-containing protein [Methyloversatilis thermotolerans]